MAKHGLTIQEVEGLKATGKNHMIQVPDAPGLYLRVGPKNGKSGTPTKSWVFRYEKKLKGPVWVTIGRYPRWSIRRAVEQAGRLREALRNGQDPRQIIKPVAVEPDPTPAPPALKTVNQLLDLFNATMEGLRESTRTEYLRFLRIKVREWVDPEGRVFGERPAVDITGADAAALLAACRVDAPRTSTMVAIKMHQCWDYAMTLEILPDKRNIWKGQIRPKIKKKDRHLTEVELVKVGKRLASCGEPEDCIIGYKLFLLAGMRHRNLAHARWEWVDLVHRRMLVPPEEHKTGHRTNKPLTVYLSTHAITLLKQLKAILDADKETKGSPWLYPKRGDKKGHRDDLGDPWERIREDQSWSDVNIHDLRRTLASMLSTLGYKGYAGEVLGHAGISVTDNYTYTAPTKLLEMLDKAGDRIMGLLEGKMKPNSDGALVVPTAGSSMTEGNSNTGEPPFGSNASRMHQPKSKPDRPKPKAKLFRRKGE